MTPGNKTFRPERLTYLGGLALMGVALVFLLGAVGIAVTAVAGILCFGAVT